MVTMNPSESANNPNPKTPDELMSDAERGFDLSHGFAPYDAEILRAGAAAMFAKGAGGLLDEKLASLGVSAEQIEDLAQKGLLNETLLRLAPAEMDQIRQRVQRIVKSDPGARSALENEGYFTDYEQERTKND